ncbi:hypothetical protein ACE418_01220 [Megasphaera sp. WILCCON 0056]|uniref:hypothetical protein n=1 Tax=Megasphaera sp. WILCCON 0056 TaxID=3345340 RepID=UPI003A803BA5
MEKWYKPGPVRISYTKPNPRPKKPKRDWEKYSDIMAYQAKTVEKIRKRLEHAKRK